ncbi:uncharacterized protein [Watersipora subatra]|uniref:uncharacterized protein n=1 Tax=Watersipora subatra TaxID=2589382 RepID=UPI00355C7F89
MLKFKKTRPKLVSRLDSLGGPVGHDSVSLFDKTAEDSESSEESTSAEEFATPGAKLRDVTKTKLNQQKRKLLSAKKQQNLLSSKDFWCRQHELKIWISETTGKDVSTLSDTKLRAYFKKFTRKWNKRTLPQKYYRGVDLYSSPLPALNLSRDSATDLPKDAVGSGLWIAPPIPTVDPSDRETVVESLPPSSTSASIGGISSFGQKLTSYEHIPSQPSKLYLEDAPLIVKTPPKPPKRRVPTSIRTTLSGATDNPISTSNTSGVRFPQPRMGSIVSSMRRTATTFSDGADLPLEPSLPENCIKENITSKPETEVTGEETTRDVSPSTSGDETKVEELISSQNFHTEKIGKGAMAAMLGPASDGKLRERDEGEMDKALVFNLDNKAEETYEGGGGEAPALGRVDKEKETSEAIGHNPEEKEVKSSPLQQNFDVTHSSERGKMQSRLVVTNTIPTETCSTDRYAEQGVDLSNVEECEDNSLSQPSSTKRPRWVKEVENSKETYV